MSVANLPSTNLISIDDLDRAIVSCAARITAARAFANRSLRIRRDLYRGTMVVTLELPMESGELLEKALDKARDDEVLDMPDPADASWSARQADAFVNMVTGFLSGTERDNQTNDNYLVTIHVDQSALQGKEGRSALTIESVKRLCCDSHAVVLTETEEGEPLSTGPDTARRHWIT